MFMLIFSLLFTILFMAMFNDSIDRRHFGWALITLAMAVWNAHTFLSQLMEAMQ